MALHVGGIEEEATAMSDINVTPLVDVMLVLLRNLNSAKIKKTENEK